MKSLSLDGQNFWITPLVEQGFVLTPIDKIINPAEMAQQIQRELQRKSLKHVRDVIATSEEIFISTKRYKKAIKELDKLHFDRPEISEWKIPVWFYDSPDWNNIEAKSSYTKERYIAQISKRKLTIGMMGFLPGFVYLDGLPAEMQVERKSNPVYNPRARVLATGGPYLGIYNLPSPSGWNILGQIPIELLNLKGSQPLPFNISDKLKIEPISEKVFKKITAKKLNIRSYNA